MKKFTLSLVFAVIFTGGLFAQRTVNMSFKLNSPVDNDNVKNNVNFNVDMSITNNGPDIIKTTDSLIYYMIVNGNIIDKKILFLKKDMAVDSTIKIVIPEGLKGGPSGQLQLCFLLQVSQSFGTDTVHAAGVGCADVNYLNTASIGEISIATSNLSAYPNPAKNDVTVTFEAGTSTAFTINIMDITGKLVQSTNGTSTNGTNNVNMNISELPAGVYMYQLNLDNATSTNKLIITK